MAEWLCSGLQSRVRRFDSDLSLQSPPVPAPFATLTGATYAADASLHVSPVRAMQAHAIGERCGPGPGGGTGRRIGLERVSCGETRRFTGVKFGEAFQVALMVIPS